MECQTSLTGASNQSNGYKLNGHTSDLVAPSHRLTTLARENGFTIHDVAGDGNCLYNAVVYQLQSISAIDMRECVANHQQYILL